MPGGGVGIYIPQTQFSKTSNFSAWHPAFSDAWLLLVHRPTLFPFQLRRAVYFLSEGRAVIPEVRNRRKNTGTSAALGPLPFPIGDPHLQKSLNPSISHLSGISQLNQVGSSFSLLLGKECTILCLLNLLLNIHLVFQFQKFCYSGLFSGLSPSVLPQIWARGRLALSISHPKELEKQAVCSLRAFTIPFGITFWVYKTPKFPFQVVHMSRTCLSFFLGQSSRLHC